MSAISWLGNIILGMIIFWILYTNVGSIRKWVRDSTIYLLSDDVELSKKRKQLLERYKKEGY